MLGTNTVTGEKYSERVDTVQKIYSVRNGYSDRENYTVLLSV